MKEKKEKILELMKDDDYVPMKAREIAMIMRVPKNEYNEFLEILGELELEFKIQKNRKNRYKIVDKIYYDGIYRKNQKGFGFIKVENQEDEVYITKENSLNALNGDRVLFEIIEEKNKVKNAEGKIIHLIPISNINEHIKIPYLDLTDLDTEFLLCLSFKSYYISDNQSLAQHQSSFFLTAAITAPAANASPAIGTIGDPAVSPVCTALSSSFGSS